MAATSGAAASSGLDSPESGVEQIGRGSAWLARATDPLAVYYNPAAIAFQATSVHAGAQLMFSNKCFTRTMIDPNTGKQVSVPFGATSPSGTVAPLLPGQTAPMGLTLPSDVVCQNSGAFPNPQLAAVFRITDKVAIGLALVAPHSTGNADWGETLDYSQSFNGMDYKHTMPSPQRYMLTSSKALIVFPTVSVAYAPTDNLSFGAGFVWGIANAEFTNFSEALMHPQTTTSFGDKAGDDVKATLKAKDLFVPGFVISALWSPTSNLDVTGWFKWQDAVKGTADLHVESLYWDKKGDTWPSVNGAKGTYCNNNVDPMTMKPYPDGCNVKDQTAAGTFKLNIPMEAKLALRYHMPRADQSNKPGWASVPGRRVRDPLSEDVFDIEADFTWANNSSVQDIELTFMTNPPIVIPQTSGGTVPKNANIPHNWKDVFGVRVGGDVVVIPNRLTLRTGGFFETQGQDAKYLQLDFDLAWKAGVGGGATVRVGPVDLSVGYQHTFYGTLDNGGNGSVYALAGDAAGTVGVGGKTPVCGSDPKNPKVGPGCFRSYQAVNGGKLTASLNEFGLAATARF
jgi:long-chain fatty acid transport protein